MATNLAVFTPQDLEQRWRVICPPVKGSWIREEDVQLRACVKEFGEERWAHIAKHIPGRRGKQCRERWKNHLDPNLNKSSWTPAEDMALLSAHRCLGNKWSEISKLLNTGRGENSVKNRFHSLRLGAKRSLSSSSGSTQGNVGSGSLSKPPSSPLMVFDNDSGATAQVKTFEGANRTRSSSASRLCIMPKRGRILGKGSAPIRRRIRSLSLGRLMSKSRRPSNAHIRSMTKAFLGVEISRIRQKLKQLSAGTKESDKRRAADKVSADLSSESTKTIARSAIRRSNSGGFNTGSPGGSLAALKAAADAAEAIETRLNPKTTPHCPSPSVQKAAESLAVVPSAAFAARASSEATLRQSFKGHRNAIHLVTASFLDREQQQRSGVAGFHSDMSSGCVKLVQLDNKKRNGAGRTQEKAGVSDATHVDNVDDNVGSNELSSTVWSTENDGLMASMPPKESDVNTEAAESLLALSLSGCGSRDTF